MQTTTFRCGHCGNLMAVSNEYLGQQVQCPSCHQVVVAPTAMATPPAAPPPFSPPQDPTPGPSFGLESITPPAPEQPPVPTPTPAPPPSLFPSLSIDEHESIFSEGTRDDLFDEPGPSLAPAPTVEYRPEPVHAPVPEPTPAPYYPPEPVVELQPAHEPSLSERVNWGQSQVPQDTGYTDTSPPAQVSEGRRAKKPAIEWSAMLIVPLISYAVLATALIFYMWNRMEAVRSSVANPLEAMPDIHGDAPGAKKKSSVSKFVPPDSWSVMALPSNRLVRLGDRITVGNLEVQPLLVERGKPLIKQTNYNPEPTLNEALLLHLRFRNLSTEFSFAPLDNAFDRKWTGVRGTVPPLDYRPFTVLQVGSQNFFGGTPGWVPQNPPASMKKMSREWVEGSGRGETPVYVDPGQSLDTFITTNGDREGAAIVPAALAHKDELVWRVHVRQGPIDVKGRSHPVPSTTVVGVKFKASDIVRR